MNDQLKPPSKRVRRVKFDLWCFALGLDNIEAGRIIGAHPLSVGRYRKPFDDPDRRVPSRQKVREIEARTGGVVTNLDWHRPCPFAYGEAVAGAFTEAAE